MKVNWETTDKVHVEMDSVEYMHLTCSLITLQRHMKKRPKMFPFLDSLYADLYDGMDGRMTVKQRERMEVEGAGVEA